MRSGREDRAAPRKRRRGIATASPTSIPCRSRRARDAPRDETYGGRGRVHHPAEGRCNSPLLPYCDDGIRARPWKKKRKRRKIHCKKEMICDAIRNKRAAKCTFRVEYE